MQSPEWLLNEMISLLEKPLPPDSTQQQQAILPAGSESENSSRWPTRSSPKRTKTRRPEPLFNKAVQFLVEARLKLATNGSQEDARALHDDAQALLSP